MKYNYQLICHGVLKDLDPRVKDIIERRFGLKKSNQRETLESIGTNYSLTRERVRQIEETGLVRAKEKAESQYSDVFDYFVDYLERKGKFRREDLLLDRLGESKFRNQISFLLVLGEPFEKIRETKEIYSFWTIDKSSLALAKKVINSSSSYLKKEKRSIAIENFKGFSHPLIKSSLEISKYVLKGPNNLYGLKGWIETDPKTIRDKVYLAFEKEKKPLHFSEIPGIIEELKLSISEEPEIERNWLKPIHSQTVHNELIKDSRFVLVGRGLYGLKKWGYVPGVAKEVIFQILKETKKPLTKKQIIKKVLSRRKIQPNTVLLNLQDKNYFFKTPEGKYAIKKR